MRAWGRLLSQFWSSVFGPGEEGWGGGNGTEGARRDIQWNCTCPGVGVKALGLGLG